MPRTRSKSNRKDKNALEHRLNATTPLNSVLNSSLKDDYVSHPTPMISTTTKTNAEVVGATSKGNILTTSQPPQNDDNSKSVIHNNRSASPRRGDCFSSSCRLDVSNFSGRQDEDPGAWIDQVLFSIEHNRINPTEQRTMVAAKLHSNALTWYRMNRLQIPDMKTFVQKFLQDFTSERLESVNHTQHMQASVEAKIIEKVVEEVESDISESSIAANDHNNPSYTDDLPWQALQVAKGEKVKMIPNFSGSENSFLWIKSLEQTAKVLNLTNHQLCQLAIIKFTGQAQEWYCSQDDVSHDWSLLKQSFLGAFPAPIQPTNIDYMAQLISRKQGKQEPVGKFIQDINRLCLKLNTKISEADKLHYIRRGLRPELQHYALSISSLQDFLPIMQHHERIELEKWTKDKDTTTCISWSNDQSRFAQQSTTTIKPEQHLSNQEDRFHAHQRSPYRSEVQPQGNHRLCYHCNRPGHFQKHCPELKYTQSYNHQYFDQGSH